MGVVSALFHPQLDREELRAMQEEYGDILNGDDSGVDIVGVRKAVSFYTFRLLRQRIIGTQKPVFLPESFHF